LEDGGLNPLLSAKDANKIIEAFLSPRWRFVSSKKDKDEIHRLADELRKASGQLGDDGSSGQTPRLSFPVISDIHVQYWDTKAQNKFAAALADLKEINPNYDALIINGDLADGRPKDYETLSLILQKYTAASPIYYTIGNHEFYKAYYDANQNWNPNTFPNGESDTASIQRFLKFTQLNRVYYDKWIHGYHFIFLGSEQYKQSNPGNNEDACLSQAQLDWLKAALSENYVPGKPLFVFLHQPLPHTVSGSMERGVVQYQELTQILSPYSEVIYFSGHTHWELRLSTTLLRNSFTMVNSSSVYQPYNNLDQPIPGNSSEGLYVEVYADRVVIRGRDFAGKKWIAEAQYTLNL
jgi:Icc protein